jgi:Tol biopolymer transport system component
VVPGSAGLYAARVVFDASGNVVGLDAPPSFLVSVGTLERPEGDLADALSVSWSPDMSKVACDRVGEASRRLDLRVVDVATGATTVVATAPYLQGHDWAPNGSVIAYRRVDSSGQSIIDTVAPDGSLRRTVTTAGVDPRFSGDSAWIAFVRGGDVWRVGAAGGKAVNLTSEKGTETRDLVDWR